MPSGVLIEKASGEIVPFSPTKLRRSLRRSGASLVVANSIVESIQKKVHAGMTTKEIYREAFTMLKKQERPAALRYRLKESIMQLGPTGYPFEKFIAALLQVQGYHTRVGVTLKGKCITHEVDVLAKKSEETVMIEAKFHNHQRYRTDVKVPLYIHSRFQDITSALSKGEIEKKHTQWIVTNTKFTRDASAYATCAGITLLGWRYPKDGGLEKMIDDLGLYPVTCLTTLSNKQKQKILEQGIVLCKEAVMAEKKLRKAGLSVTEIKKLQQEVYSVCKG